jgi:hypothetical protein
MPEQKVVVTIDEDGGLTAKTSGFKGETCLSALDELLSLDGVISHVKTTDEYHQEQMLKRRRKQEVKGN